MNTNANINVQVTGIQALNQLQQKVAQTSESFGKLKTAIAGFATASFIKGLYDMANNLTDMAAATGVSTQAIMGFTSAVAANGGTIEGATQGVGKFVQAIEGAAGGSKELQDKFLDLNISLSDLKTLSEQDLLRKTVDGLAATDDNAKRLAVSTALFGKSFRSVDIKSVSAQLDEFNAKAGTSAGAVQAAGDASQNFNNAFHELQISILAGLKPLSDVINFIAQFKTALSIIFEVVTAVGLAFLGWRYIVAPIAALNGRLAALAMEGQSLGAVFGGVGTKISGSFKGMIGDVSALGSAITGIYGGQKIVMTGTEKLMVGFSAFLGLGAKLLGWVGILWTIYDVINAITKALTGAGIVEWGEKALKALGIISQTTAEKDKAAEAAKNEASANREVVDALQKEKMALDAVITAYKRGNEEANKKFKLETDSLNLSEAQKLLQEEQMGAYNKYLGEFNKLQDQINEKRASGSASEKGMVPVLEAAQAKLTTAYGVQKDAITGLVAERVANTRAQQLEIFQNKEMIDSQNKLKAIQDDIAKSTMSELEKKYYDITAASKASAKAAIEAENQRRNAAMKDPMSKAEEQAYYDAAMKSNKDLMDAEEERYVNGRKASTGWKQAMNDYAESATNAAENSKKVFQTMAQGMEDMLMKFFTTGKLGWKDFANSVIQELMRIEVRKMLVGNSPTGGGGILGGIGSLLGFASGGVIPTNGPVIVGERGPELLSGAGGMTVTPNNALGGTNVTYNINAVDAQSFKQMLAQDPTFLFAVSEQGRRKLPGAR